MREAAWGRGRGHRGAAEGAPAAESLLPAPRELGKRGGAWPRAAAVESPLPWLPRSGADARRRDREARAESCGAELLPGPANPRGAMGRSKRPLLPAALDRPPSGHRPTSQGTQSAAAPSRARPPALRRPRPCQPLRPPCARSASFSVKRGGREGRGAS